MVVHMNLWRPLMCCKSTVVNPKIRCCLKHRAIWTDGNQRTLPGYITSDLPTTRALRRLPGPTRTLKWRVLLGKSGAFCKNVMLHIRVNSRGILDGSKMLPICESRGRPKWSRRYISVICMIGRIPAEMCGTWRRKNRLFVLLWLSLSSYICLIRVWIL